MSKNKRIELPVSVYGKIEPYNEVLSKARVRTFYKYENRNGTYITDEFAEKLISSIPYAPIKGIYDNDDNDYEDHGKQRTEGRIYGVVPSETNFAWEDFKDDDGEIRTYACVDVLLYTGLYPEANEIVGKSQSMEIYAPSIKGSWKYINGRRYFVYTEGCFLGLQVLGDDVEPCFEGAAFFSLYDSLIQLVQQFEHYQFDNQKGGSDKMPTINFKLSDSQKAGMIFNLLNPDFNEEGKWTVSYSICDIYDEYALCYNYENGQYERVIYTKNDETDSLELGEKTKVFIVDITEAEKEALNNLHSQNGGTYEKVDELFGKIETLQTENSTLTEENATFSTKLEEAQNSITTLTSERDTIQANFTSLSESSEQEKASLTAELDSLKEYKLNIIRQEKTAIIAKYSQKLDTEIINQFTADIDSYTVENLEKELAFALVKSTPSVFSLENSGPAFGPKNQNLSGLESYLQSYKK